MSNAREARPAIQIAGYKGAKHVLSEVERIGLRRLQAQPSLQSIKPVVESPEGDFVPLLPRIHSPGPVPM
ncbi:MAG: hypothetical protein KY468_00480 [Armatimonadetes bacterium]|nr:hypothetical protein [Armatimonadota bacterium]